MTLTRVIVLLIVSLLPVAVFAQQPKVIAIKAGRVLDVRTGQMINNAFILIEVTGPFQLQAVTSGTNSEPELMPTSSDCLHRCIDAPEKRSNERSSQTRGNWEEV